MLSRLLSSALIAGAAAGLIATLLQLGFVQPVLLHAELYEGGELTHFAAPGDHHHGAADSAHDHDRAEGAAAAAHPDMGGLDLTRDGLSVLFSILVYAGYALLLVAAIALAENRGHTVTPRQGLLWGIAGFVAVQLAPAFGLAPELPGMAAANITQREIWWLATVALSAAALWLIAFGKSWATWAPAIVLAALPHLVGAPHPAELTGPTPPELAAQFAGRALGVGLVAWVALGLLTPSLWSRGRA
ncbi:CbtA family protein [Paracoccus sp. S3-43]|uniref:CbtA family protein n=1 Tax=Paracoccus sp. S3-43 TaxID=3030011 RepID=UPI0023B02B2A|nr:CbtA family protein [Paracoccus sp. S3-43]WEF24758.1 CbtA family protein [Paracoccus sp. S3-43]